PVDIHEMAVGLHFFYPVELTGLVEIIFPDFIDPLKKKQILQIMESLDLYPVVQDTKNAFAINRLLLPVQAEAFRLLQQGYSAEMINICSKSARLKIGVFEMMDSVGLDVLLPAIKNYVSGMPVPEQEDYRILISGLKKLMQTGKLGKKNKNGILIGDSLPWEVDKDLMENKILLQDKLNNIFKKTCSRFVREKQLNAKELDEILNMVYS
ncbi:MAG: 3-hydroxyacyl-CoA dehydrogenase family protein, partial [Calditrichaceae bacterium]